MVMQHRKKISMILWIFIFCVPVMDLFTSFMIHVYGRSSYLALFVKMSFLLFTFVVNVVQKNRKVLWYGLAFFLYVCVFFLFNLGYVGYSLEAQNLFRTFYFPLLFFSLFSLQKEGIFEIPKQNLSYLLLFYLIFLVFPDLFHVGFQSYAHSKEGSVGWFYSANEIGGILAILGPFLFRNLELQKRFVRILLLFSYFAGIFILGLKAPVLALSITLFSFLVAYVIRLKKRNERSKLVLVFAFSFLALFGVFLLLPFTSFYKNIVIHLNFLGIRHVSELFTFHHIDHFIFSERLSFLLDTHQMYSLVSIPRKIFGMGVSMGPSSLVSMKMIEMDFFDIFYHYGVVGFLLFLFPFISLRWVRKFSLEEKISLFLVLLLSFFTGHILVSPSVSLIVVLILLPKSKDVKS